MGSSAALRAIPLKAEGGTRPEIALDTFRRTDESPDLPVAIGKVPFTTPSPQPEQEPAAPGKRPAKTVQSKVVPSGAGQTMPLDAGALPTPTLPFSGSTGSAGVIPVPDLPALQYLALRVELMLQPAPRDETKGADETLAPLSSSATRRTAQWTSNPSKNGLQSERSRSGWGAPPSAATAARLGRSYPWRQRSKIPSNIPRSCS